MTEIANLPDRGLNVAVLFDSVTITIVANSEYEAQVLFEDLVDRLQKGETISIEATTYKKGKA